MTATFTPVEELGAFPAPPPARPRVLIVATVLATTASVMTMVGMLAVYLHERNIAIANEEPWLPGGVTIPLTPANMGLTTMLMSAVLVQWAVYAIGNDDRRNTWVAFGLTLLLGMAQIVEMAFMFTQMALPVATRQGALIYAIVGGHVAMVGAGMVFLAVMAFRTLGGQYSARDREGLVAASIFWYATVGVYAALWYAVFVMK